MAKGKIKIDFKDPKVIANLVVLLIILGGSYMWYEQVYVPLTDSIASLTENKEKLNAKLLEINALKPQLERLRKESVILEAKLDSLKNIFPDSKEIPRLIRDLTAVNRKSNIVITRFTPKPDVVKEYYVENKYDLAMVGDYHNLGELFSHLANFQLIVNLANVTLSAGPGATGAPSGRGGADGERLPSITATFELTTFSSKK